MYPRVEREINPETTFQVFADDVAAIPLATAGCCIRSSPPSRCDLLRVRRLQLTTAPHHLVPFFGSMRLSTITTEHVRRYVAVKLDGTAPVLEQPDGRGGRIKRTLSAKTINNQVGLLGLILGHAAADGLIAGTPRRAGTGGGP